VGEVSPGTAFVLRLWVAAGMLFALMVLTSCATPPPPSPCVGWAPIRPEASDFDTMSDALVEQLLAHNAFGQKQCGWKP
jgi:hypothetical protein